MISKASENGPTPLGAPSCYRLHNLLAGLPKLSFESDFAEIPRDGIYILFETGEMGHGMDRIVRVGTHTGAGNLAARIREHFLVENKDRSIFRKNIGRALLNHEQDLFLESWQIDLTSRAARDQHGTSIDRDKLEKVEELVSEYIRKHLRFAVIRVDDKKLRLDLESRIISTVSLCSDCKPSETWLGLSSPVSQIRESGLWLVKGLYKEPLSELDFQYIERFARA